MSPETTSTTMEAAQNSTIASVRQVASSMPTRESACEGERTSNVRLAHALNLVNGPVISGAVAQPGNAIQKLIENEKDNRKVIEEIYLACLGRLPDDTEVAAVELGDDPKQRLEVAQDLAWALMNSPAFLFNR